MRYLIGRVLYWHTTASLGQHAGVRMSLHTNAAPRMVQQNSSDMLPAAQHMHQVGIIPALRHTTDGTDVLVACARKGIFRETPVQGIDMRALL